MFSFIMHFDGKNYYLEKKISKMTDILKRQKITNAGADVEKKEMNIVVMYTSRYGKEYERFSK